MESSSPVVSLFLPPPHPATYHGSIAGLSALVLVSVSSTPPHPHSSTLAALSSLSCSMMKSWIQATFVYFLAKHLEGLVCFLNG